MILNQSILAILRVFLNLQKKFLSKIPNRKKISNEHCNLCEAEISLDVS